jgi:hypothetical protein
MENAPLDTPESSDDSTSTKKKRRKSFELGKAVVDRKEPESEAPQEEKRGFSAIFEDKEEKKEESETESETVSEAEAPADGTLSPQEKDVVVKAIAAEAAQGLSEHDPTNEPEEAAGDMLVAEFYEKLEQNPDIAEAAQEAVDPAGIELPPLEIEDLAEVDEDEGQETEDDLDEEIPEPDEELVFDRAAEAMPAETVEDPEDLADAAVPGAPAGAGAAGGGHGGGTVPPTTHGFGGGPGAPFGPAGPGGFTGPGFNAIPATPNRPQAPTHYERIDDRGSPAAFFVAGGIVGYLIGRRRGRIKTEKKLLPVQKKLEKQVEDLHWQIKAKESQIRKVAAEKVRQDGPAVVEALVAKRAAKTEKAERPKEIIPVLKAERAREGRAKAPEANILHTVTTEHLGQMLMSAEAPAPVVIPRSEQLVSKTNKLELKQSGEKAAPVVNERSVETLSRAQLLQLSEQIVVEGSSLRQIYETHLVGEKGLRRLIIEHLRGGDMAKALKREITEREIDFERDPVMRDLPSVGSTPAASGGGTDVGGKTVLDQMVKNAAANLPAVAEEAAFYKAKAAYEADQSGKQLQRQQVIDISFGAVIVILLGAVVYLLITRG